MFDRTFVGGRTTHHHHMTINQQPNDAADAARLYGELQDKAGDSIKEIIGHQVADTKVEFVTLDTCRDVLHFKDHVRMVFKINGKTFETRVEIDEFNRDEPRERVAYRAVAEGITNTLMDRSILQIYQTFARRR
ncbi:hypothetical protein NXC14_CH01981 [Rhizobium sp. NXC14]|uniref:hypothetical protein n=1 Tax=Rhizobium sp. NXC14 TaxID=1981173 RepID=UPI000A20ABA6|nr:hypothetical protein [Rhizobium sp. NXC14]ARO29931.1 hypothetical protein NXC14_CH01981 [Rhizobium sp. NXC14]